MPNPIPLSLSGLRGETPDNLILDAGVAYLNINETLLQVGGSSAFADAINPANTWTDPNGTVVAPTHFGATRGGARCNFGIKERQVVFDSGRIPVKGLARVDEIAPMVRFGMLEVGNGPNISLALGQVTTTTHGFYKMYQPKLIVPANAYVGNLAIFATVSGESLPLCFLFLNAKSVERAEFNLVDKNELAPEVSFAAHSLANAAFDVPVHIYMPEEFSS